MKAITLSQPWAQFVALDRKRIETRSWRTSYRGEIAIHAAKKFPARAKDEFYNSPQFRHALGLPEPTVPITQEWLDAIKAGIESLPLGVVIATAQLIDCVLMREWSYRSDGKPVGILGPYTEMLGRPGERDFGFYTPGRYAWILSDVKPLPEPIPAKGALSLWEWKR